MMFEARRTTLLAFVDDEIEADVAAQIETAIEEAPKSHAWTLGPPRFVDSEADGVRTLGCELEIYAPTDEAGNELPPEMDRSSLADTKALIRILVPISARNHIDIGLELGGMTVGWIMSGEPDRLILGGLIGPWEEHINARPGAS